MRDQPCALGNPKERNEALINESTVLEPIASARLTARVKWRRLALVLVFIGSLLGPITTSVEGQQSYVEAIGIPAFSMRVPVENGFIDASTGRLHLEVPLGSFPQRGARGLKVALMYDSSIWTTNGGSTSWQPSNVSDSAGTSHAAYGGWRVVTSADAGSIEFSDTSGGTLQCPTEQYSDFAWKEPDGTVHTFAMNQYGIKTKWAKCLPGTPNGASLAFDGSGYYMSVTNYTSARVYSPDGNQVYPTVEDTNGNYFPNPYGLIYTSETDTLGRTAATISTNGNTITYAVSNSQGGMSAYTVKLQTINVDTNFQNSGGFLEYSGTITVVQEIDLPDQTKYLFGYDSGTTPGHYGLLTSMTLPTGGQVTYSYANFTDAYGTNYIHRWIAGRTTPDGAWNYTPQVISSCTQTVFICQQKFIVQKPSSDSTVYIFTLGPGGAWPTSAQYYNGAISPTNLLATITQCFDYFVLTNGQCTTTASGNSSAVGHLTARTTTLPIPGGTNLSQTKQFTWDTNRYGNIMQTSEWKFYSGSLPSSADRITNTTYQNAANYVSKNILDHPATMTLTDGSGNTVSQTNYSYDGSPLASVTGAPNHDDTNFGTGNTIRGNLTQLQRLISGTPNFITTSEAYDTTGQVTTSVDGNGNVTTYGYANNFFNDNGDTANPVAYTPSSLTNAYLKTVTKGGLTNTYGYYWGTGQKALSTDPNNQTTYTHYFDSLSRLTSKEAPDGGWAFSQYNSTETQVDSAIGITGTTLTTNCPVSSNACRHDQVLVDSLGRVTSSVLFSDPDGPSTTAISYDSNGRVLKRSNPFRSTSDTTYGWTTPTYDGIDRTIQIQKADGSTSRTYFGVAVTAGGGATTQLCASSTYGLGYPVLRVDEAGKKSQTWTDGFGRMIEADEPNSSGSLSVPTCYSYDLNDNLTGLLQNGSRQRAFTYDYISRLLTATNPESGLISYSYDANGNLATKTALAPNQTGNSTVITSFSFDALDRITQKSYNDSGFTPTVKYGYDAVPLTGCTTVPPALTDSYPKGRRTSMCDGAGAESWNHDTMGRVVTDLRTTSGNTKSTTYAYNLDGSAKTLTYPSGRTVSYTPNAASRIVSAVDSTGPINYALNAKYAPQGALASIQNSGSLYSTFVFNNRLQPCWVYSTTTSTGAPTTCAQAGVVAGVILDYQFDFGAGGPDNGNVNQIANRRDPTRTQNFTYDQLNRIATAQTQTTGVTIPNANCWGLTFGYDPWGNLLSDSTTGPAGCSEPMPTNFSVTTSNRISTNDVAGQTTNYCYDASGNLIFVTAPSTSCPTSGPYQYTYNAENQLTSSAGVFYIYDGDGKRVQKSSGKLYWYGMSSDPIDETDLSGNLSYEFIFLGGQRIARRDSSNNVNYYFTDHLGTVRIITNAAGTILDDSDFYPFGGERLITSSSGNSYKFTGKERDSESGLDNFEARYNSSSLGRFMSADQIGPAQHPGNPQSWNLYSYVLNNPLKLVDPSGEFTCDAKTVSDKACDDFQAALDKAQDAADKIGAGENCQWQCKEYLDAQRAIDAYGDEGVDNGVVIAQGNVGSGLTDTAVAGNTVTKTKDNPNGQNIRVTFDTRSNLLGADTTSLAAVAVHEGVHVADGSDWVSSGFSSNAMPSLFQTEWDAYQVTGSILEGLGAQTMTFPWPDRSYTFFLPLSPTSATLTKMIKNEYPKYNLDAFSRDTKIPRPPQ
jgi:RHS repeat-associated protein